MSSFKPVCFYWRLFSGSSDQLVIKAAKINVNTRKTKAVINLPLNQGNKDLVMCNNAILKLL